MPKNEISNVLPYSKSITISRNNSVKKYDKNSDEYNLLLSTFSDMIADAILMPAFGVSLDKDTKQEKINHTWIEFFFDETQTINEMPFDSLLIFVSGEHTGFNLHRGLNGIYSGRCFYLRLSTNMQKIEKLIENYTN